MIMRSWYTLLVCLLTTAICLVTKSLTAAAASPAQFYHLGRRPMRDLEIPHSSQLDADQRIKVPPKETAIYTIQPDSLPDETASNEPELVYHIDYHGVTTHPNPIPRHPKP